MIVRRDEPRASSDPPDHPGRLRDLTRLIRRDPHHAPELLMLYAVQHLQDEAPTWLTLQRAAYPDATPAQFAGRAREQALSVTWLDGAVAGTPFLLALVPAYVTMLLEQARMAIRIAAAYGDVSRDEDLAAEILALRGVYPSPEDARTGIAALGTSPTRGARRDAFRAWIAVVFEILVLAGFLDRRDRDVRRSRTIRFLLWVVSAVLWVLTWVFPTLFMIVMGWSADRSTRDLAARAIAFYAPGPEQGRPARLRPRTALIGRRSWWLSLGVGISIAVPFVLVVSASSRHPSHLVLALKPLWPLLGLSVVLIVAATRRRHVL